MTKIDIFSGFLGAGKTTLLLALIRELRARAAGELGVIEADLESDVDALKIKEAGVASVELNTRGVCHVNEQGMLDRVVETFHLKPCDDGKIRDIQENGDGPVYAPETPVSMNFWGFTPWLFEKLDAYFKDFLRALPDGELKKECLLPSLIGELIDRGELSVSVLRSSARWFGMTYHEDKEMVQRELQKLHDAGVYPKTLRA